MPCVKHAILLLVIAVSLPLAGCKSPTLTVMTFNIRYDTPSDGPNAWPKRRDFVADIIRKHDPDLLGLQEVLVHQRDQLLADLKVYDSIGVGRDDGDRKGEFSPVFYRKSRFVVIEKGWFWLSETPDVPGSKGWDAACSRIATWVNLRDLTTHGDLMVWNTHFDHQGNNARLNSAVMLGEIQAKYDKTPRIIMGDFNCGPDHHAHRFLAEQQFDDSLRDAFVRVVGDETDAGTFNGFEGVRTGPRIDWILHSDGFVPLSCEIVRDSRDGRYPSDHFPVVARFRVSRRG